MKIKKQLIKRDIAGDTILVPVGKTVYESNGLFVLNEVATFIWDNLSQLETEEEIVSRIMEEYEVSPQQAQSDTAEFLVKLRELNIID